MRAARVLVPLLAGLALAAPSLAQPTAGLAQPNRAPPNDAVAIRSGGTQATLKGIQFNSFGAFFSRAYRENDYLWGRLHGGERLIDIVVSALPEGKALPPGVVTGFKRDLFRAILAEERNRLETIPELFETLAREVG